MDISVKEVSWEEGRGFSWSIYVVDMYFSGKAWVEETAVPKPGDKLWLRPHFGENFQQ